MSNSPLFKRRVSYQEDVLALPVADVDAAARCYTNAFGLREVERRDQPHQAVILERDSVRIGFAIAGGDASNKNAVVSRSRLAMALAALQMMDLVATKTLPQFGDAHLDHLGVPDWLRPRLPVAKAAAVLALVATATRPKPRSVVGAALVAYYAAAATFHVLSGDEPTTALPAGAYGVLAAAIV